MRLIDADDIVLDYSGLAYIPPLDFRGTAKYFAKQIDAMPTIDAIPIEYIKNQIGRWERSKCESYHAICYRHLIEEWEMENEHHSRT